MQAIVERIPHGEKNPQQWVQKRVKRAAETLGITIRDIEYTGQFTLADGSPDGLRVLFKAAGREGFGSHG